MGANENVLVVRNAAQAKWILDADGDTWQSGDLQLGSTALSEANLISLLALL
jgi:hypothetical protein